MYRYKSQIYILFDIIFIVGSFLISSCILFEGRVCSDHLLANALPLTWMVLLTLSVFYLMDLYFFRRDFTDFTDQLNLFVSLLFVFAGELIIFNSYSSFRVLGGRFLLLDLVFKVFLFFFGKAFLSSILKKYVKRQRALIIGDKQASERAIKFIKAHPELDIDMLGIVSDNKIISDSVEGIPVLGKSDELLDIVRKNNISLIIISSTTESQTLHETLIFCHQNNIYLIRFERLYENVMKKIPYELIDGKQLLDYCLMQDKFKIFRTKRFFDVLSSLLLLLVSLPIMGIAALLIKWLSPGPVFYLQTRSGVRGKPFKLIKFRTMHVGAETETGPTFTIKDDKRVTPIGRFLRHTHIDEIPQLVNVLKGDMSFIGPRPERPEFILKLEKRIPFYSLRLFVKPGISGWAQIAYQYVSTLEGMKEKFRYDLYYLKHLSFMFDFKIVVQTILYVLTKRG